MTDSGSVRHSSGSARPFSKGSDPSGILRSGDGPFDGLIRFNPFHMEGRNRRVVAKSEVRVDE